MTLRIDIISDVVCPWCAIGYYQLAQALDARQIQADIHWLPFELNPAMPPEGQNVAEHIAEKYGTTKEQSQATRAHIVQAGADVGFTFNARDNARIWNTFDAHRLLQSVDDTPLQTPLKLALFKAYFTDGQNISDKTVLATIAKNVGMDAASVDAVLSTEEHGPQVRALEASIHRQGVSGVPTMIFARKYLLNGAQGVETYGKVLDKITAEAA